MAEAILLGSGTSAGVPVLGIEYPPAFLANPKNHRMRPSLYIANGSDNLLIDATPELRLQLLREEILDVHQVLITHTHADHVMGMDDLRAFCLKYGRAMPIYAYPEAQEDIRRIFAYAFRAFPEGVEVPQYDLHEVPPVIAVGDLRVETMTVMHGPLPVVAVRANNFAYVTDVSEIPPAAWDRLQGLDTLILDAVRYRPHPNHYHFERAVEVAQELGAKMTYFTHLSHDYDHDETEKTLPPNIRLGYDGLRIPIL